MAQYDIDNGKNISNRQLAVVYESWRRKAEYERSRPDGQQRVGPLSRLFGGGDTDPVPGYSAEQLEKMFGEALVEREPRLGGEYSSAPGELNDRAGVSVKLDARGSEPVRVRFEHSKYFFGNEYSGDGSSVRRRSSRDFISDDAHLGAAQRQGLREAEGRMLSELSTLNSCRGLSDRQLREELLTVDRTLSGVRDARQEYVVGKDGGMIVSDPSLGAMINSRRETAAALRAQPFPGFSQNVRIKAADREWNDAAVPVGPAGRSRADADLSDMQKSSLRGDGTSAQEIWSDCAFRDVTLRPDVSPEDSARHLSRLYGNFAADGARAGCSWKEVDEELSSHLGGMSEAEKKAVREACHEKYNDTRRGVFDGMRRHIDRGGSVEKYDCTDGYSRSRADCKVMRRMHADSGMQELRTGSRAGTRREAGRRMFDEYDCFRPDLCEKVSSRDADRRLSRKELQEYREGYYDAMGQDIELRFSDPAQRAEFEKAVMKEYRKEQRKEKARDKAVGKGGKTALKGVLAAGGVAAFPAGLLAAGIMWAFKHPQETREGVHGFVAAQPGYQGANFFAGKAALPAFCRKYGIEYNRGDDAGMVVRKIRQKAGHDGPEMERMMRTEYPEQVRLAEEWFSRGAAESVGEDAQSVGKKVSSREHTGEARSTDSTSMFVYVTPENAASVMKSGKLDTVSFENVDYGTPDLLVGKNAYAVPGDGLYVVKDKENKYKVYSKEQFESSFSKVSGDRCVQNDMTARQMKPKGGFGKGLW